MAPTELAPLSNAGMVGEVRRVHHFKNSKDFDALYSKEPAWQIF